MRKTVLVMGVCAIAATSCVPQRKYEDLNKSYTDAQQQNAECNKKVAELKDKDDQNQRLLNEMKQRQDGLQRDTGLLGATNRRLTSLYAQINDANEQLLDKVKELESRSKIQKQELSAELLEAQRKLNEKEVALGQKELDLRKQSDDLNQLRVKLSANNDDMRKLQADLMEREKRVAELSRVLYQKDSVVKALQATIGKALLGFRDKGLTVNVKNGKVYVSVEEKLLFQSGKYAVNSEGRTALLELARVLNAQPDVSIVVEGHTDNVPLKSSGIPRDNWDLSVLRATEVGRILTKDGKVDAGRVTAAGRGDTQPIAPNETPDGRARNRRTEIILTPQLGELFKVLEGN